jgi:hypothetical protein
MLYSAQRSHKRIRIRVARLSGWSGRPPVLYATAPVDRYGGDVLGRLLSPQMPAHE